MKSKFVSSLLLICAAIVDIDTHNIELREITNCLPDKGTCHWDGSLGLCCSGTCIQMTGQNTGFCKETKTATCIADGEDCHYDGINGKYCCSQHCTQNMGEKYGKCRVTATSTPSSNLDCIPDKHTCEQSGKLGNCCSGFCYQSSEFPTGFCKKTAIEKACLDGGEECTLTGTKGFCCSGFCNQTINVPIGFCTGGPKKNNNNDNGVILYSIIGGTMLTAILFIVIGFLVYRERNRKNVLTEEEIRIFMEGLLAVTSKENRKNDYDRNQLCQNADTIPYDTKYEIKEEEFKIDETAILGMGAFGIVMKGSVGLEEVAVKTVHEGVESIYVKSLLSELKVMIHLGKHVNIVGLVGAFTKNLKSGSVYIFYELCSLGSLESYLRANRNNYQPIKQTNKNQYYANVVSGTNDSTVYFLDLLNWSYQIANGMEYLVRKQVVHADLATRNLLLTEKHILKITDFGLSRRLYNYNNYVKKHQEPLPWRWMAIESIRELSFSSQSDVWMFGVTLWEIFSMGDVPYGGLSWSTDFVNQLLNNLRLPKPIHSTQETYLVMTDCWQCEADKRPSFGQLKNIFLNILNHTSDFTFSPIFFTFSYDNI